MTVEGKTHTRELAKYEFKGNPTLWRKLFLNSSLIAVQRRICNDEKLTVFFR